MRIYNKYAILMLEKWVSWEMFGGNKEICNSFVFVIDSLNQFGWHCEAYRTVCLPPSHLRRGIKGLGLGNPNRQGAYL